MLAAVFVVMLVRPERQADRLSTERITYRIDVNSADRDTLSLLPGIAQGKAQRIVDDREANGVFNSADEMTRVHLIGEKTVAGFEPWVRFDQDR